MFQGKTALVTGSGTGIGQAIAKKFVENGASVIILGRRKAPLEDTSIMLNEIISKNNTGASVRIFSGVDVADESGVTAMFDSLQNDGVVLDYVVNNAGVSGPVKCFTSSPLADFKGAVQIHLTGTFWGSVQALRVMKSGGKIITISTFFTEERPLEQRPYRFRSPYTASQGAKNRLAELISWELTEKGIISIATNPGPVHSDRIYKTVYPKAAAEFMRVGGFEDLDPEQVNTINELLLPLLGEDDDVVRAGIVSAAKDFATSDDDLKELAEKFTRLLEKIQTIAEKVQKNTSRMIANREFLSQDQVATSVLNLCGDEMSTILNGKVIPGDRVFYPVKPHVTTTAPDVHTPDFSGKSVIFTIDATNMADAQRVDALATHVTTHGGKVGCFISNSTSKDIQAYICDKFHSHVIDIKDPVELTRWLNTAKTHLGDIACVIHITGRLPDEISAITDLSRSDWDGLVEKFITTPAIVAQNTLGVFVPGGNKDPRLYRDAEGAVMIIGPDMPAGRKVTGVQRAQVEVFRGALRPFTTTVNQELADVLKSNIRIFTVLPGSVAGAESDDSRIASVLDYMVSGKAKTFSPVVFCVDELR